MCMCVRVYICVFHKGQLVYVLYVYACVYRLFFLLCVCVHACVTCETS